MLRPDFKTEFPEARLPDGRLGCWMTTAPSPKRDYGPDQGQMGWRLHIVPLTAAEKSEPVYNVRHRRSLCGITGAHGWGLDLFIDTACARCEAKLEKLLNATPDSGVDHG